MKSAKTKLVFVSSFFLFIFLFSFGFLASCSSSKNKTSGHKTEEQPFNLKLEMQADSVIRIMLEKDPSLYKPGLLMFPQEGDTIWYFNWIQNQEGSLK